MVKYTVVSNNIHRGDSDMKKILTVIGLMLIVACSVMVVVSCENTDWGEGDGDPTLLEYELSEDGTYYSVAGLGNYVGTHLVIPEEYNGLPVKKIEIDAFCEQDGLDNSALLAIKAITIADSVTDMGEYMSFAETKIEKLNIGSGVKESIRSWSFGMSNSLKEINVSKDNQTYMSKDGVLYSKDGSKLVKYPQQKADKMFRIPRSVNTIKMEAFYGNGNIKKVKMGNHLTTIESKAFYGTTLEEIKIPNSVEIIGSWAFGSCKNLKKVKIGRKVRIIEGSAFYDTLIEEIKIPNSVEKLEGDAFESCEKLKKVHIGSGVKEIGDYTFAGCDSLEEVVLPKNIEKIGTYAFAYCESLKRIIIPKSVKTIGAQAFYHCDNLTEFLYRGTETEWKDVELITTTHSLIWGTKYNQPIFSDNTQIYTYSKKRPSGDGNYWRYILWMPTVWKS
ncbi:MAG: leucine-rich repeat domain-containing protein [Clostridiales bacterium]|nr:leucine-rich repeat domain-containing protein [Clostridiales bacterium]